MNYPTFLKKVDQLAAKCDADSLRLFVHEIARTVPESSRQRFFATLNDFCDGSPDISSIQKGNDAHLSDRIDHILQALCEIQNGDRELESEYNEEWDDWNDDAEDEFRFSDPSGVLDDIASAICLLHDALDQEVYEKGAELAQRLSELTIQVSGDYEDTMGIRDLVSYDLLDFSLEQTVKEAVYLAYMGTREPKCAEAMLMIMDNFADYSIPLEAVLQMGSEEIDLNALLPSWMEELAKRPEAKADSLLKEAQDMLQDKNDILNYASRYAESHPILYQNILQKGLRGSSPEEMTQIGLRGLKEIPVNHRTRSVVSLLTAKYALETQNRQTAEKCWLEAFVSLPTVVNYLRLRLQAQCWENYADMARGIYVSCYASRNQWDQKPLAALMFFDTRFEEMIDRFMKPGKGIGWSSTFMKEGIALMLMLLDTGSGNRPGMIAMREIAVHACSFDCEGYCAGTDVVSNSSDTALFQECFDKWKSQTMLPENAHELWTAKIEQWIALRVSAIMVANRRNYYGECAAFIAALGEVQESERPGYKDHLMQQYRADYSRRRAFHDELGRYGMRKWIANEDRHLNNFGAVRNAETLEWIGMAPVYDSGSCLGYDKVEAEIRRADQITCKPFKNHHEEQLKLVNDFSWIHFEKLSDVNALITDVLSSDGARDYMDPNRVKAIAETTQARIRRVQELSSEKRCTSEDSVKDDVLKNIAADYRGQAP